MAPGYGMGQGFGPGPGNGMVPGYGPGPGNGMGPGAGMMMGAIDADQSGTMSAEEAAAHAEAMFALMDVNGDGALAADEMGGGRMGMMSPWGGALGAGRRPCRNAMRRALPPRTAMAMAR